MKDIQIGQQELLATVGELTIVNGKLRQHIAGLEAELESLRPKEEEKKEAKKPKEN